MYFVGSAGTKCSFSKSTGNSGATGHRQWRRLSMYSVYMYLYLFATHNTITYKILQFKDTKKCRKKWRGGLRKL